MSDKDRYVSILIENVKHYSTKELQQCLKKLMGVFLHAILQPGARIHNGGDVIGGEMPRGCPFCITSAALGGVQSRAEV